MAFNPPLTYKGFSLVRCKNDLYLGSLKDPYVVYLQILSTKIENGEEVADRVHISLLSTDASLTPAQQLIKQTDKNGLYAALDISSILLERKLSEAKKAADKK